ncbi:MAG: hypothetical protein KY476_14920 [Planctomycetes bacterium]|nr:hypothetical protein [Planctomycetota bacterium]
MKPIPLDIPGADHTVGALYPPGDVRLLKDGMLHVAAGGVSVDVSWHPEHDPQGRYIVSVYQDEWERQLAPAVETTDVHEAAAAVARAVRDATVRS